MSAEDDIALRAARQAVQEFIYSPAFSTIVEARLDVRLQALGLDTNNPEKTRSDLVNLREWNEFWRFLRNKGVGTAVGWVVTGLCAALAAGVYIIFQR